MKITYNYKDIAIAIDTTNPNEYEKLILNACEKTQLLQKYKEDVEQVELFGMERVDYLEKKEACIRLINELRELEQEIKKYTHKGLV